MSDVILKALKDMQPEASYLIDRAYAAGQRAAKHKASANLTEAIDHARTELAHERIDNLTARIDTLADTTNENLAIIAEALGSVLINPDEGLSEQEAVEFLCQLHDDGELPAFVDHCRKQHEQHCKRVCR